MKFHIRTGSFWAGLTPAAAESIDQILTLIGRTVSGDGAHWDSIVGYAQAARPSADVAKDPMRHQVEVRPPRATIAGVEAIERTFRDIPQRDSDA